MARRRCNINYNNTDDLEREYMSLTPRPVIFALELVVKPKSMSIAVSATQLLKETIPHDVHGQIGDRTAHVRYRITNDIGFHPFEFHC